MNIRKTFLFAIKYLGYFYFRRDPFLFLFSAFVALYTASNVAAFVLIFSALRGMVAGETSVSFSLEFLPALEAQTALYLGLGLFGASIVFFIAALLSAIRTGANFGTSLIYRFEDRWDKIDVNQRKDLVTVASFATRLSRPVLNSLVPIAMFVVGIVYLSATNIFFGPAAFLVGALALFAFVPANKLNLHLRRDGFSYEVKQEELAGQRKEIIRFLSQKFSTYRARRIIAAVNILILFLLLMIAVFLIGPEQLVEYLDEQAVVVIVVIRASILSLNRLTLCLKVINSNIEILPQIFGILERDALPGKVVLVEDGGDDDDEI